MKETEFCSIKDAAEITGLSARFIRQNLGSIPHAKNGRKNLIHLNGLREFALNTGKGVKDEKGKESGTNG